MGFVHGDRAEPALPEMTAAFAPRLDDSGIVAMHPRERAAQPVWVGRHQDEVHMVWHQTPGPHIDPGRAAIFGEQVAIERIAGVLEEGTRATVAALGSHGADDRG